VAPHLLQLAGVVALLQQHVRLGQADLWNVEFDTTIVEGGDKLCIALLYYSPAKL
jgi:hypothetical protein